MITSNYDTCTNTLTCGFSGKMDTVNSQTVSEEVTKACQTALDSSKDAGIPITSRMTIVFDMADVPFVASAFLRICMQAAKKVDKGSFKIINTQPMIKKTFKLAGMDQWIS